MYPSLQAVHVLWQDAGMFLSNAKWWGIIIIITLTPLYLTQPGVGFCGAEHALEPPLLTPSPPLCPSKCGDVRVRKSK